MCENLSVQYIKVVLGLKFFPQAVVKKDIISGGSPPFIERVLFSHCLISSWFVAV